MTTTLVGFCESLTFCAPYMENTVGNIANAFQELRFPGEGGIFVTIFFKQEANLLSRYSSQYVVI